MADQADNLAAMRHSLAHIMATAVQQRWPEAKFGVGPAVQDGFYYDRLRTDDGSGPTDAIPLRARSMVGLVPLLAVEILDQDVIVSLPGFRKRMRWFLDNRPELAIHTSYMERTTKEQGEIRLLAIPSKERLVRVLQRMLDEREFLSPHGIR